MKKLLFSALVAVTACAPDRTREVLEVPTYSSPCTLGATCPNGSDIDPHDDHTAEWQALTCQDACKLLLQDRPDFDYVFGCEPMRRDQGFWVVTCDYAYTAGDDDAM